MFASKHSRFQRLSLSLQDCILLFGILVILLTFTAQDVKAAVGTACPLSEADCILPDETCSQDRTCVCGPGYYEHNSICKNKLGHRTECNASFSGVCQDSTTHCVPDKSGQTRCLCDSNSYYYSSSSSCSPLANLKVSDISHSAVTTDSVTLTWRANNYMSPITYEIQAIPSEGQTVPGSVTGSRTGGKVTGLTPGTQYTFNVTSVIRADSYYPEKRVSVQSSTEVWTKPAKPGAVTSVQLVSGQPVTYNITFGASQGQVAHYHMRVNRVIKQTTGSATSVRFTNLQPGQSYTYTITAYNEKYDPSETSTGTLNTPVTASGPVSDLTVKEITYSGAIVTWKKPDRPNGEITGYTLTVTEGSTCVYGYTISCSGCSIQAGTAGSITSCQNTEKVNKTSAALNSDSTTFTVQVSDLEPYHNYTVKVTAGNTKGTGAADDAKFRTLATTSGPVSELAVKDITHSGATVTWKKPDRPNGDITGYTLTVTIGSACVYGHIITCLGCSTPGTTGSITSCQEKDNERETSAVFNSDFTTFTVGLSDLEPYRDYTVRVTAHNTEGIGAADNISFRTLAAASGPVSDLTVKVITQSGATVTWKKPDRPNGDITGYTLTVTEGSTCVYGHIITCPVCPARDTISTLKSCEKTGGDSTTSAALNVDSITFTIDVSDLEPYHKYTVRVTADNTEGTGAADNISFMTSTAAPSFEETLLKYRVTSLIRKPESRRALETAIDIVLCASCLVDDTQGKVEKLGLIVCKVGTDGQCLNQVRRKRSVTDFDKFATWISASQSEFQQAFRATSDAWMLSLKDDNNSYPFTIGNNESCSTFPNTTYCNGPLPANSGFRVAAIKCNAADCLMGPFEGPFTTETETSNDDVGLKAGLGVGISLIVILIIVIILGVLWYRRKSAMKKEDRPYNEMDPAPRDSHDYQGMPEAASTDPKRNEQIWMAGLNKNLPSVKRNNGIGHDEEDHYDTVIENQDDESVAVNNEENPYRNKPKEESPYKNTSNVESPYKNSPKAEPPYVNSPKEEPPYSNSPKKKSPFKNSPKKRNQNNNVKIAGATNDYENLPL